MQSVTSQFLASLLQPHNLLTVFTYTVPGGDTVELQVKTGTVSADASQRIRRTASLTVFGTQDDYAAVTTPGTVLHIDHGLDYGGGQTELVPVFHGELTDSEQRIGDGTITITAADHGNWLSRVQFLKPYSPAASTLRTAAISSLVTTAKPGTTVVNSSSDTGTLGSQNVWSSSRLDAITSMCRDGMTDAVFGPDGTFVIEDLPTATSPSVWTVAGVIESGSRKRPMDRMYNTVVVQPSTTDGSQTWAQQTSQITDTTNPRHPNYIGVVPFFWQSPTIASAAAALAAAKSLLFRVMGTTETLTLGIISNPALDVNDTIRVETPPVNDEQAQVYQHFIDQFSLDLVSGSMSLATRSQAVSIT